jgi:hypothetical protein
MNTSIHHRTHPAVHAFMARNGVSIQDLRSDGKLTLTIDGKYRVHVHSGPHNRVALTAELMSFAGRSGQAAAADALERLLTLGAGMLQQHPSTLCFDDRRDALLLQLALPASAEAQEVEKAIAELVNVLPFWRKACANETRLMSA